jgi:plastocyanin
MPDVLGLPAHPLLVHAVVVLVPLAATGFLALVWRRDWWQRFGPAIVLLACAGATTAVLAVESGQALQSPVRRAAAEAGVSADFGAHPQYGSVARACAVLFAVAAAGAWWADGRREASSLWSKAFIASRVGGVAFALAATGSVVLAGHSGSKLVWRDLGSFAAGRAPSQSADALASPAPGSTQQPVVPEGALVVTMRGFRFEPEEIRVAAGSDVTIAAINRGRINHSLTVVALKLDSGVMRPGETKLLTFSAPASPRTYEIICTEEGHDEEGMFGRLVVE